ncbi:MAG: zinc ABC transporter solute-binding protein [Acaryochloris sp. RU_4_1]|nr:zinc ABC transporter solute-binding protein [Acaryochloris sp. SU_5_25]NJM64641.1 zinc ABC transporter solute-binding protein [Acaryochloris sp. RU_4_1]NJR53550.1 zinc ABC transporter solute-binding protein [Acaryochloris sp. CRU_2_0]
MSSNTLLCRLQECRRIVPALHKIGRSFSVVLISTMVMGLSSCTSPPSEESPGSPTHSRGKLQIVTTFLPITNFTKAVVGDRAQVTQLLPNTTGPHDYQTKPEDIRKLTQANILVENGLEMEVFLEDVVKNANNQQLKIINSSEGVATISSKANHPAEQDHPEAKHNAQEENHSEAADPDHQAERAHEHGEANPHIWLDPKRAIQQVENIRDGLIAADPEGQSTYTANAAAYIEQLKQLDQAFAEQLKPYAGKTFVTYHDFADYFAQSYDLKVEYLVGIPEENATPEDVKRVITAVQSSHLKTLLTEPQVTGSPFTALAKDLKVKIGNFDPLETGGAESLAPEYYLKAMRNNLKNLTTAFGQSAQSWVPATPRQGNVATLPHWMSVKL